MARLKKNKTGYSVTFNGGGGKRRTVPLHTNNRKLAGERAKRARIEELEVTRIQRDTIIKLIHGKSVSIEKAMKEWKHQMSMTGLKNTTITNHVTYLNQFLRRSKIGERSSPAMITDKHVNDWVNGSGPHGTDMAKAGTRTVRLAIAKSFLTFCEAKGYTIGNPANVVRRVNLSKLAHEQKEVKRKIPFTDGQIVGLLRFIDEEIIKTEIDLNRLGELWRNASHMGKQLTGRLAWLKFFRIAVPIARWLGLRIGDIAQLEWDSFKRPGIAVVWTHKRDKRVELPINEALSGALAAIQKLDDKFCFPAQQKLITQPGRDHYFSKEFDRICKSAGIKERTFHCLRSTFGIDVVDRLVASGKTKEQAIDVARQMLGHSHANTTQQSYLNNKETT